MAVSRFPLQCLHIPSHPTSYEAGHPFHRSSGECWCHHAAQLGLKVQCRGEEGKRVKDDRVEFLSIFNSMASQCSSFSTTIVTRLQKSTMTLAATGFG